MKNSLTILVMNLGRQWGTRWKDAMVWVVYVSVLLLVYVFVLLCIVRPFYCLALFSFVTCIYCGLLMKVVQGEIYTISWYQSDSYNLGSFSITLVIVPIILIIFLCDLYSFFKAYLQSSSNDVYQHIRQTFFNNQYKTCCPFCLGSG